MNRCVCVCLSIVTVFVLVRPLGAQDPFAAPPAGGDIFGGGNAFPGADVPFGAAPAAAAAGAVPTEVPALPDPLIVELQRYAKGDNRQLALAIRSAVQISDWNEAAAYLDILGGRNLTDADYAEIASTIRPNYLLRLRQHPSLSDAQRGIVAAMIAGAQRHAEDRDRIKKQIARLDTSDDIVRMEVIGSLRDGGLAAISELSAAYVLEKPVVDRVRIFDALSRFEDEAAAALRQYALNGQSSAKPHALRGLIQLDLAGSMPDLVSAYHGLDATDAERRVARDGMSLVLRSTPSATEAEIYLAGRVDRATQNAARVPSDDNMQRVWQLDDDQQAINPMVIPLRLAAVRTASEAASRYARVVSQTSDTTITAMIADFSYQSMVNPEYGTKADFTKRFGSEGPSQSQLGVLQRVLETSIGRNNEFAAIAAIRFLKHSADQRLIASHAATPQLLVTTASHPTPRVRYEAAIAAASIDYQDGYSGSSDLLHRWIEMSALHRRPTALILEARKHRTDDKISWLESLGYDVQVIVSVADLLRRIESGGDIQLLVAGSQPTDRHIIETIDLIRRRPLGGGFPILIYCQPGKTLWDEDLREKILDRSGKIIVDVAGSESAVASDLEPNDTGLPRVRRTEVAEDISLTRRYKDLRAKHAVTEERQRIARDLGSRWTAPLMVVERITSPMGLALMVRDLTAQLPMPPMTPAERQSYTDQGLQALWQVVRADDRNNPYDFRSHEQELTSAIQAGGFSEAGLSLLSSFGTPKSQATLANLADSIALPLPVRQSAAKAFAASVQRFGTRIDRHTVAQQYERFNSAADVTGQATLGVILDAMEQRAKATAP